MAEAIRVAIEESGRTQKDIAVAFGITEQAVSGWLRTGKVNKARLPQLAELTGKPLSHFGMHAPQPRTKVVREAQPVYISPREKGQEEHLRVYHLGGCADMGDGRVNDDYPEVISSMDFRPAYLRSVVGFVPPPGRLVLVTGRGDSMIPVIQPGETLIVDSGVNTFEGDGLYLINTGNGQQIKGLQDRGQAIYVVSANAALYPAFPLPPDSVIGGKVYLRNRIERLS